MAPPSGLQISLEICLFTGNDWSSGCQFVAHGLQRAHIHCLESKHSKILDHCFLSYTEELVYNVCDMYTIPLCIFVLCV